MVGFKELENKIYESINLFSKKHFLLGVSGGADSMALLHLFLHFQQRKILTFQVCTVDHQIRISSAADAHWVSLQCERLGISCSIKRLYTGAVTKNIEHSLRLLRFEVLIEEAKRIDASAVVLAHQKDDQIESILKRIFEGGKLEGIKTVTSFNGFPILRPLLTVEKSLLHKYLLIHHWPWIEDLSNRSDRFTRNRLRNEILPFLQEQFGKKVGENLIQLSHKMHFVEEYFQKKASSMVQMISLQEGYLVDFSQKKENHPLELEHCLLYIFQQLFIEQNRKLRQMLLKHILANSIIGPHLYQNFEIYLDRGRLFFMQPNIKWGLREHTKSNGQKGWLEYLLGNSQFLAPLDAKPFVKKELPLLEQKKLQHLYQKYLVPRFLQDKVPVLYDGNKVYECLTPVEKEKSTKLFLHKVRGKKTILLN